MSQTDSERPRDRDGERPVDEPAPVDAEQVANAPEREVTDADRPVDDDEFVYPAEQDEA